MGNAFLLKLNYNSQQQEYFGNFGHSLIFGNILKINQSSIRKKQTMKEHIPMFRGREFQAGPRIPWPRSNPQPGQRMLKYKFMYVITHFLFIFTIKNC